MSLRRSPRHAKLPRNLVPAKIMGTSRKKETGELMECASIRVAWAPNTCARTMTATTAPSMNPTTRPAHKSCTSRLVIRPFLLHHPARIHIQQHVRAFVAEGPIAAGTRERHRGRCRLQDIERLSRFTLSQKLENLLLTGSGKGYWSTAKLSAATLNATRRNKESG